MSTDKKPAKILSPLELDARVQELESLIRGINSNLEVIKYSCNEDKCMAGRNLADEAMDWIKAHNITPTKYP